MINLLKNILNNKNYNDDEGDSKNLELICGLMIEAAYTDGTIGESEIIKIKFSLINVFDENEEEVDFVLDEAIKNKNNSKSLHHYTSFINKNFDNLKHQVRIFLKGNRIRDIDYDKELDQIILVSENIQALLFNWKLNK